MQKQKTNWDQQISTKLGTIVLIIIAITVGVFVWKVGKNWEITEVPREVANVKKPAVIQTSIINQQSSKGELTDAVQVQGWKKYTSDDKTFSLEFPGDWKLDGSIFSDASGKKIAESQLKIVDLQPNKKCFENVQIDEASRVKLLSKTNIVINKNQGVLLVEKVMKDPGGGFWYPNMYCIRKENKAFFITFYDSALDSGKKNLFDKVMSTLEF